MAAGRGYPAPIVELLGHSIALTTMLGANQKDAGRITLQVQGSGPVRLLVADCTADLKIRGMAHYRGEDPAVGEGRLALSFENLASGQIYQSLVPLEGATMAEIFQNYLH